MNTHWSGSEQEWMRKGVEHAENVKPIILTELKPIRLE